MVLKKPSCCDAVIPPNAARSFKNPAPVFAKARVQEIIQEHRGGTALEIGAGCLRNSLYLQSLGFDVTVLEVQGIEDRFPKQYKKFRANGGRVVFSFPKNSMFDIAVATYVIETICRSTQRKEVLSLTYQQLKNDGAMILSVRGPADLVTANAAGIKCSDGYLTPNRTFARSYSVPQLSRLLSSCGFEHIDFLHLPGSKQPELLHALVYKRPQ